MASPATYKWCTQRTSIFLRSVAAISSLAALIAFGWSQTMFDSDMVIVEDAGNSMVSPVTGATEYTFVWSLIIASVELSLSVPIHPAIYVTFDLLAWAALVISMTLYLLLMNPYYTRDGYSCGVNGRPNCNGKAVADIEHFGTAMAFIALIIHFGYFVWSCRAVDKMRKGASKKSQDIELNCAK
ncbi:hypothetical protein ETB97_003643 [Aspergillus alliaceus]|uniref:MARVEL domain-containing protein n=1 Tax=Petromyces alliaceus TaxID=209559 RepID=A0A5N7C0S6_PETAA|nr:uncharacterized protein BDW43DRAFT_319723 [Aspergillus alliaceus]KAB8233545.1 hypothetical protein BDW43DRAFT_319723 [Aspergillus alliaceus]KAE8387684.1 hypothetical protein BDV23DRAFT_186096 [Aspergillus alliaceus]KAF5858846.1 hypothetical protein ETB97_003643 [Aspergillus burnettii]